MGYRLKITLNCGYCNTPFSPWASRPGSYCSRRCCAASRLAAQGTPTWKLEENNLLEELCGVYPFPVIVRKVQSFQRCQGWAVRSECAIETQIKRLHLSVRRTLDNMNGQEMADALGVPYFRLRNWVKRSGCPFHKIGSRAYIPLKEFRAWAMNHAHLVSDLNPENLLWVLQDQALVEQVCSTPPVQRGKKCPVMRLDTEERFPTIAAAARSIYVEPAALRQALLEQRPCAEVRFQFVHDTPLRNSHALSRS